MLFHGLFLDYQFTFTLAQYYMGQLDIPAVWSGLGDAFGDIKKTKHNQQQSVILSQHSLLAFLQQGGGHSGMAYIDNVFNGCINKILSVMDDRMIKQNR